MEKLDLAKKHQEYYTAKEQPEVIEIAAAQFLSHRLKSILREPIK